MRLKGSGNRGEMQKKWCIHIGHSPVIIDGFLVKGGIIVEKILYNMITEKNVSNIIAKSAL